MKVTVDNSVSKPRPGHRWTLRLSVTFKTTSPTLAQHSIEQANVATQNILSVCDQVDCRFQEQSLPRCHLNPHLFIYLSLIGCQFRLKLSVHYNQLLMIYSINVTKEHGQRLTVPPRTTRGPHHQNRRLLPAHLNTHLILITSSFPQCLCTPRFPIALDM